ncbi:hypothetical protein QVD17_06568 [Tagetes erecta]|uniref:CCHC-type domain-containing protein n=1 Tax=Tagetes erecta TaxID=13708 RepID=A0AAD8LFU5_TARER|nr:hypothetical protein QVD17_06568 [Tagetes erecta]
MTQSTLNMNYLDSVQPYRPPRLVSGENFEDWKRCLKAFFYYTYYNQWESIVNGPHVPKKVEGTVTSINTDLSTFTEGDIKIFTIGLLNTQLPKACMMHCASSMMSMMVPNIPPQNAALITSAANSHIFCVASGGSSSLGSVKSVGASTSVGSGSNASVTTQIPSDTMALFGMFVHSYEALVAGELKGKGMTVEDMYQVDLDDLKETDIQWQMAMLTLRARRFMERTSRKNFGNQGQNNKLGYDKGKLRCYNCKQLGHFKRECPLPIVTDNSRTVPIQERLEEVKPRNETALLTNFDWSAEIEETKEEINHALVAEIVEDEDNYINCFDPFKEFYSENGENYDKAAELKCEVDEEKDEEWKAEKVDKDQSDAIVQGHLNHSGLVCEAAVNEMKNDEESKLNLEAMIEKARLDAVDEFKRSTPYCQCDRALAAEKLVIGLPYDVIEDMCSSACKIRLIGIYKANKLLMTNENELKKINKELKENESKFFVKLREALKENEHLKRSLLEKNCEINYLTEQVTLAEFETRKVKNKLEQWTISAMKREELCKKQRGARVKTGLGYNNEAYAYPPPSTFCYSPTPIPYPSNELIQEIIQNDTNSSIAGLSGVNLKEVREDYAYGGSTGLGCSSSSDCSNSDSKKSVEDVRLINFVSSNVLHSDNFICNSNLGCSTSNFNMLNDDVIENVCMNDKDELSERESSFSSMNHIDKSKSESEKVKVTTGKSKEPYDSYSDCNSQLSECDEEIEMDKILVDNVSKVGLKSLVL